MLRKLQQSVIFVAFFAIFCISINEITAQTTTVRPYKFGFTIDQQQHRSEKRDERGIVMGEFGFITADGIYHVTVYATDEEGKFRILAMRNYPYESPPKTVDMIVTPKKTTASPPAVVAITTTTTTTTTAPTPTTRKMPPKFHFYSKACSGCFLKNGPPPEEENVKSATGDKEILTPHATESKTQIRPLSKIPPTETNEITANKAGTVGVGMEIIADTLPKILKDMKGLTQTTPQKEVYSTTAQKPTLTASATNTKATISTPISTTHTSSDNKHTAGVNNNPAIVSSPTRPNNNVTPSKGQPLPTASSQFPTQSQQPSTNSYANNNAPADEKYPQTNGAPSVGVGVADKSKEAGVGPTFDTRSTSKTHVSPTFDTRSDFGNAKADNGFKSSTGVKSDGDLYRFKYILDYNGHTETGSRNGNKEGNYFAIGNDNIERTIEYVANEFGYQPRIRWRKLDTPVQSKENTLKDYEFVWFNKE